jgi:hypothetical protein
MPRLIPRRNRRRSLASRLTERRADRITVGLAVLALAPVSVLVGGELLRMARRRRVSGEAETPTGLADVAGYATRDTLRVARRGIRATSHHEAVLFNILQGFLGAFAFARLSTWGIRSGWWPSRNVKISGRHIHHFIPGILIAFAAGTAALTIRGEKIETAMAVPFGVGMGLTMDEAALLLGLEDVTATLAATIIGLRVLRRGEQRGIEEGLIPQVDTHEIASTGALA